MKLQSIGATHFGGCASFDITLTAANYFVGANFAGKTRIANAIKILLLGYLPELGKSNRATFGLSSGREMTVWGTFDNGLRISRRFYVKGDTVKQDADIPEEIENLGTLAFMLNAEEYFLLSDRERVAYVFGHVKTAKVPDVPAIIARDLAAHPVQKVADVLAKIIPKAYAGPAEFRPTFGVMIEQALLTASDHAKNLREYAGRMERGAQAVQTLRAAEAPLLDAASLDQEHERISEDLERLTTEYGAATKQAESAAGVARLRSSLQQKVNGRRSGETALAALRSQIEENRAQLEAIPEVQKADIDRAAATVRETTLAVRDHERDLADLTASLTRSENDLKAAEHAKSCPYCGTEGEAWKGRKEGEIRSAIAGITVKITQTREHLTRLEADKRTAIAREEELREAQADRLELTGCARRLEEGIKSHEDALRRITEAEADLAALPAPVEGNPANAAAYLAGKIAEAKRHQRTIDDQRKALAGRKNDLQRIAEAEKARDEAKADLEVATAALESLRKIQATAVQEAFGPLLAMANGIFGGVLTTPLAYHEGEIGTWRDGVWVSHRVFSGTEKALAYAAIQAALAQSSPIRIMIVDELGRLDNENALAVAQAVNIAIARGDFDTFIGIDAGRLELWEREARESGLAQVINLGTN